MARYSEMISSLGNFGYITTYQMVTSRLPIMLLSIGKDHSYMDCLLEFFDKCSDLEIPGSRVDVPASKFQMCRKLHTVGLE